MILYIHGFGSCGDSTKSRLLKAHFGPARVIAPDLPADPDAAVAFLHTLIHDNGVTMLVGLSLGGYYAAYLSRLHGCKAVLINPSTRPYETLAAYVGVNARWCDGRPFEWKEGYLDALRRFEESAEGAYPPRLVLLQTGDEVLDYRIAAKKYAGAEVVVEEGGNHRFENLGDYLGRIEAFYFR